MMCDLQPSGRMWCIVQASLQQTCSNKTSLKPITYHSLQSFLVSSKTCLLILFYLFFQYHMFFWRIFFCNGVFLPFSYGFFFFLLLSSLFKAKQTINWKKGYIKTFLLWWISFEEKQKYIFGRQSLLERGICVQQENWPHLTAPVQVQGSRKLTDYCIIQLPPFIFFPSPSSLSDTVSHSTSPCHVFSFPPLHIGFNSPPFSVFSIFLLTFSAPAFLSLFKSGAELCKHLNRPR